MMRGDAVNVTEGRPAIHASVRADDPDPEIAADMVTPVGDSPAPPQCSDGVDNDGDTLVDYPADPECTSATDDDEGDGSSDTGPLPPPENLHAAL